MRRFVLLFVMSMLMSVAWGQTYSYRFWLDNNDAIVQSGSGMGETQLNIDLKSVTPGVHALHLQARKSDGAWSSVHTRWLMNIIQQTAATARYWVDSDASTMHNEIATNGIIDIDASLLSLGLHAIHYQTISADGTVSSVHTRYVYINKVHQDILKARVCIDSGEATEYALADGDIVMDIGNLSDGEHTLKVDLVDYQGIVQGTKVTTFTVTNLQPGDVNGDGAVDIGDIVKIISVMTGTETNPDAVAAADVNGDNTADIGDIVAVISVMTSQPAAARSLTMMAEEMLREESNKTE